MIRPRNSCTVHTLFTYQWYIRNDVYLALPFIEEKHVFFTETSALTCIILFKKNPYTHTKKKNKQKTHKKPHSINFRLRGCIKRLKRINMALPKNSRSTLPSDCKKKSEVQNLSYFIFWIGLSERKKTLEHTSYY